MENNKAQTKMDDVQTALDQISQVVGPDQVVTASDQVERLSRVIIPVKHTPLAYVYPGNTDEVIRITKIAARFKLPLWPCSKGKNWGYGSATPCSDGVVVLVLERMNAMLEVNEELAYAVIEPGVTYRQLNRHLKEQGIRLWCDCTDGPQDASIMGNALERGIGETDYGDHFEMICGLEVVLPDGTLMRTGGGDFEKSQSWNVFKWGRGPYLEGLFSQSNLGIVTKMGIWLMPEPEAHQTFTFELLQKDRFIAMIDAVRRLELCGAVRSKVHIINDFTTFAVCLQDYPHELLGGASSIPDAVLAKFRKAYNIAHWSLGGAVYGSAEQVKAARKLIKKELAGLGRLMFFDDRKIAAVTKIGQVLRTMQGISRWHGLTDFICRALIRKPLELIELIPQTHAILKGVPTDYFVGHAYFKSRLPKPTSDIDPARDACGLIWAGPVIPLTGRHVEECLNLCRPLFKEYGFDFYTALMVSNPRSVIALLSIFYDKASPAQTERAKELYDKVCDATAAAGYHQYRTSTMYMDRILKPAPEFQQFAKKLKAAIDPDQILAPGKYGL